MKLENINRNRYVSAKGHNTKNAFDMFPRTDIAFDILPILSCHCETVCLLGKRKPDAKVKIGIDMDEYYRIRENAESK